MRGHAPPPKPQPFPKLRTHTAKTHRPDPLLNPIGVPFAQPMPPLLLLQVTSTWAMTAVIWFVQLVQYPSFARVGEASFADFHAFHSTRITLIVGPLMIVEALSSVALVWRPAKFMATWEVWVGLGLVLIVWASTALLQVPMHQRLGAGFDENAWRFLCNSNWVRTFGWSARALLVTIWLHRALQ